MKNFFAILFSAYFFLIEVSCTQPSQPAETKEAKALVPPPVSHIFLYPLFIENTLANPAFERLIDTLKTSVVQKKRNAVFQFYHSDAGYLTLAAMVGKRNREDWDSTNLFKLSKYECPSPDTVLYIDDKKVFLGDLELKNLDNTLSMLKNLAKDHTNHQYVFFMPKLKALGTSLDQLVYYDIYFVKDQTDVCGNKLVTVLPATEINPSPPRKGN